MSAFMAGMLAVIKWTWKISSANSFILMLLALSVLGNFFYSARDTSQWWSERNAGKFMARLGVGPNMVMSKAIHLRDIDDITLHNNSSLTDTSNNPW